MRSSKFVRISHLRYVRIAVRSGWVSRHYSGPIFSVYWIFLNAPPNKVKLKRLLKLYITGHFIRYTLLVLGWTPFCVQNCLNYSWHRFNKVLETFLRDFGGCGVWRCSISTKGPKVCQENIPHTITPPAAAWTVETRQDGSMLSCSLHQILTLQSECRSRNRDSSDQATVFQSSIVQFWWASANCRLFFLFLADRSGIRCGLLLLL